MAVTRTVEGEVGDELVGGSVGQANQGREVGRAVAVAAYLNEVEAK